MTPAATPPVATSDDPLRAALDDPRTRADLIGDAQRKLAAWLPATPSANRAVAAEDAVQETMARVWQKRATFNPASGTPLAWLHGFLGLVLLETVRELRQRPVQPPASPEAWEYFAREFEPAIEALVHDRLDAAEYLARLTPEHRQVLEWRYRDGLEIVELAERWGVSAGTARVRLCRAVAAVRLVAGVDPGEAVR